MAADARAELHLLAQQWEREVLAGAPEQLQRHLREQVAARDLRYLGRPIVDVLRPVFVPAPLRAELYRSAELVAQALLLAARALADSPSSWDAHRLEEWERRALGLDRGALHEIVGRLDALVTEAGTPRFLEYNPVPAGVVEPEELSEVFGAFEPAARFVAARGLTYERTRARVARMLAAGDARRGGTGAPRVTMLTHPSIMQRATPLSAMPEMVKVTADLAGAGCRIDGCAWDGLERRGDRVVTPDGRPLEVVLVDEWEAFLRDAGPGHPLWGAVATNEVWLANSLCARVALGRKSLFEPLSDEAFLATLPPATADACRRCVPWTRVVADRWTEHEGRRVDLLSFVRQQRHRLVLKPANRSGGAGVVVGVATSAAAWDESIERSRREPHVVQERIAAQRERFPFGLEGEARWEERAIDLSPLVWLDGVAHGLVARTSSGELMNLTAGSGSMAPVFLC